MHRERGPGSDCAIDDARWLPSRPRVGWGALPLDRILGFLRDKRRNDGPVPIMEVSPPAREMTPSNPDIRNPLPRIRHFAVT